MNRNNTGIPAGRVFSVILSGIALFFVSSLLSHLLFDFLSKRSCFSDPFFRTACGYLCFIPYWIIIPAAIKLFRPFRSSSGRIFSFRAKEIRDLFAGALAGFFLVGICALLPLLDGSAALKRDLSFRSGFLPALFICVLIQAGGEELLFRSFFQRELEACAVPCWGTVIIPALLFAAAHILNSGITLSAIPVLFSSGLIYGLLFRSTGSFTASAAMHAAWNFCQSILFGFPNSGVPADYSLLTAYAVRGKTFSYDPSFGLEASLSTLAVHLSVISLLLLSVRRRKKGRQAL